MVEKIETILCSITSPFFQKILPFKGQCGNTLVDPDRPQMKM